MRSELPHGMARRTASLPTRGQFPQSHYGRSDRGTQPCTSLPAVCNWPSRHEVRDINPIEPLISPAFFRRYSLLQLRLTSSSLLTGSISSFQHMHSPPEPLFAFAVHASKRCGPSTW